MTTLLVVQAGHVGGRIAQLVDAALAGVGEVDAALGTEASPDERVLVRCVPALEATAADVRAAQGVLLATPEHFGYMSGALKHFFDTTFYQLEPHTVGLPYALLVSAGQDGTNTVTQVQRIVAGYRWKLVAPPLLVVGEPQPPHLDAARELGATFAAGLGAGVF
jgi:NAD(P)H-dependent FMN reductase